MNNERALRLITRFYQSGLLLDANLLLVLIVGLHYSTRLGQRKRVKDYKAKDLILLRGFVGAFSRVLTTPSILTEVSNLSNSTVPDYERDAYTLTLRTVLATLVERYPRSTDAAKLSIAARLGLTDASIEHVARYRHAFVLSADDDLVRHLHSEGLPAIDFAYLKRLP